MSRDLILIAHNLRSAHNVGSLLRTADGLAVREVIFSGYTPYPLLEDDTRLPHIAAKVDRQVVKTALGAERSQAWRAVPGIEQVISELKRDGYTVVALEQTGRSEKLPDYQPPGKVAIVVGNEVEGLKPAEVAYCAAALMIPMLGSKESLNVVQAAAMALYHCRFWPFS
jgi:23S rRNA (guanosine2251-2'-O)-methyltransferase